MPAGDQLAQRGHSEVPADVWGAVARATLRAEGDSVHAWERLCRVSRAWRAGLTGAYIDGSQHVACNHDRCLVRLQQQCQHLGAATFAAGEGVDCAASGLCNVHSIWARTHAAGQTLPQARRYR